MPQKRVTVAMSGGVDSSLAAARLKAAGYEVSGVYLQLWPGHDLRPNTEHTVSDLEHTCQLLDIPLCRLNLTAEFQSLVVERFCREYSLGCTPNPCVFCNQHIKFGLLLEKALGMGADYLATGHYASIEQSPDGCYLLKAVDLSKDQSYFLYTLGQRQLQHLLLPLGNLHKAEVRRLSSEMGLPAAAGGESQDICFIPDSDYRAFIARRIPLKPGDIVDTDGRVLGRHNGLAQYTVGQRQGLGLASDKRLYVLRLDAASNRLVVGSKDRLSGNRLLASRLSWVSGEAPGESADITAKIRYRSPEVIAKLHLDDGIAEVDFQQPQWAIAPGQSVVFYQGDIVLGGGIIEAPDAVLC